MPARQKPLPTTVRGHGMALGAVDAGEGAETPK